jgi:hypothetical protein
MSNVTVIQELVGEPRSHWIGDQWIPAEGSRLYTTDEIRSLFQRECTLFVGDSLQRRAADTLHIMLTTSDRTHTPDVHNDVFTNEFFNNGRHDRGFKKRHITVPQASSNETSSNGRTGCVDTDWRPLLEDVNSFVDDFGNKTDVYSDYSAVVLGSTIWDVVGSKHRHTSAKMVRHLVNETIFKLHNSLPQSVFIVWKGAGWCDNCPWTANEELKSRGNNYKIYAMNDQARTTIESLNSSNLIYLPWAREILPRSIGKDRLRSTDGNPYHYNLQPRLQFLQMLSEVYDKRADEGTSVNVQHPKIHKETMEFSLQPSYLAQVPELSLIIVLLLTIVVLATPTMRRHKGKLTCEAVLKI